MTKQELWEKINNENAELLCNLRERWSDEHEYEDINDYLDVIKNHIPEAFKIYKRPFGIDCQTDDGVLNVSVKVKGNYMQLVAKDKK